MGGRTSSSSASRSSSACLIVARGFRGRGVVPAGYQQWQHGAQGAQLVVCRRGLKRACCLLQLALATRAGAKTLGAGATIVCVNFVNYNSKRGGHNMMAAAVSGRSGES